MRWFGEPWGAAGNLAPICENAKDRVKTPVAESCLFCLEPIEEFDQGVLMPYRQEQGGEILAPLHLRCLLADVLGRELAFL